MRRSLALATALVAALALAVPAVASDSDVYHAWSKHDRGFCKLGKTERKRAGAWERRHSRRNARRLVHTLRAARKLLGKVIRDVAAAKSSSRDGATAKKYVRRSDSEFDAYFREFIRAIKADTRHHEASARRHGRSSNRHYYRSIKYERRARKAFKRAGVKLTKPPHC